MKTTQLQKYQDKAIEGKVVDDFSHKKTLAKVILKNAPSLLGAIPLVGDAISAVAETTINSAVDYWDELAAHKREKEWKSFLDNLDKRLKTLEVKAEAKDYFENSIIFKFEDIKRKLFTEPDKGFDELLAEFVSTALSDLNTPVSAKDLILATLLAIDSVDLQVLKQIDTQFKWNLQTNVAPGVKVDVVQTLMKSSGIDSIMISRSLQRLQGQDLIHPLNPSQASLHEMPSKQGLLEGEKTPQYYSGSGFVVSAFGRRFLRFLKLSD